MPKNKLPSHAENNSANQETQEEKTMSSTKILLSVLTLSISISASDALAKPNMTDEQLAKAREVASKLNPPIDFDAMIIEADRLGVECEGDLTRRAVIKMCKMDVDTALLDEETARLREENTEIEARLRAKINALSDSAEQKLNE